MNRFDRLKSGDNNDFMKAENEVKKKEIVVSRREQQSPFVINKNNERKEQMSITLTPTHKKKLKKLAKAEGVSASSLISEWIETTKPITAKADFKERKEQMSITLTPSEKETARGIAEGYGISVSELIGYWIVSN